MERILHLLDTHAYNVGPPTGIVMSPELLYAIRDKYTMPAGSYGTEKIFGIQVYVADIDIDDIFVGEAP